MNNDIKEILDKLKDSVTNPIDTEVDQFTQEAYGVPNYFCLDPTTNDCKVLLDYITNLQTIEQQYSAILSENAELENKITNLQEKVNQYENPDDMTLFYMWLDEKAKDKLTNLQQIEQEHQRINGELREENKKLNELLHDADNEVVSYANACIDLQSKIDKAIPILKELNIKLKDILKIGIDIKEISDIEETLQGEDNE